MCITGTDTGVGKTLVTAALARCLVRRGARIGVMKPIETGCDDAERSRWDSSCLQMAAGTADPLEVVSPYRFGAPLAPKSAAEQEHRSIDVGVIVHAFDRLARDRDLVLVEGAGGLLVPIGAGVDQRDLMVRLGLPVLVVGRTALGGVNHARLTLDALAVSGLRVAALVLNRAAPSRSRTEEEQERSTVDLLRSGVSVPVLGPLPFFDANAWEERVDQAVADPVMTALAEVAKSRPS